MALYLRRLPEPIHWVGPAAPARDAWPEVVARSPLTLALCGEGAGLENCRGAGASPMVAVGTRRSVGPEGARSEGVRILGAPAGTRSAVRVFPSVARVTFERAKAMVRSLARDLAVPVDRLDPAHHALLVLADGDSGAAGLLASALASALPGLPLVGGSFTGGVALDGRVWRGGAAVVLLASPAPLATFHSHPFELDPRRTVVTACDSAGRQVTELDGFGAVERFSVFAGIEPTVLDGSRSEVLSGLDVQLAWVVGGRVVLRPVVGREDGALTLAGGVQRGAVLRLVRRRPDVLEALLGSVRTALDSLPVPPVAAWAFACSGFVETPWRAELEAGLQGMGVLAAVAEGVFDGPTHACGGFGGLVFGDVGGG